jgi:hypothetical protein
MEQNQEKSDAAWTRIKERVRQAASRMRKQRLRDELRAYGRSIELPKLLKRRVPVYLIVGPDRRRDLCLNALKAQLRMQSRFARDGHWAFDAMRARRLFVAWLAERLDLC